MDAAWALSGLTSLGITDEVIWLRACLEALRPVRGAARGGSPQVERLTDSLSIWPPSHPWPTCRSRGSAPPDTPRSFQ